MSYLAWAELADALAANDQRDDAREAIDRARAILPTLTLALYEKGLRIAWRDRDKVVEPQLIGLLTLKLD